MRLSQRSWISVVCGIAGLFVAFAVLGGQAGSRGRAGGALRRSAIQVTRPVVVPLQVRFGQGSDIGARPMIEVRVGNGPRVPVLLDTGSVGLHIDQRGVRLGTRSGVRVTSRGNAIGYVDGMEQDGVVASAKLTIDGITTSRPVRFGLIRHLGCVAQVPDCPGTAGIGAQIAREHSYGIMGIGLDRSGAGLENPLRRLPAAYSHTWSIALAGRRGELTLAAHLPAAPSAHFHLTADGRDSSGERAWNDEKVRVCWGTTELRGAACEPTVFDTGSVSMQWYGGLLSHATTAPGSILVSPGTYIVAWSPGSHDKFWGFTAGTTLSQNTVLAHSGGQAGVTAAVQSFYTFTITYDAADGNVLLSPSLAAVRRR